VRESESVGLAVRHIYLLCCSVQAYVVEEDEEQ
jgi:hypothetical protein